VEREVCRALSLAACTMADDVGEMRIHSRPRSDRSLVNRASLPVAAARAILATLASISSLTACTRTSSGASEPAVRQVWDEYLASKNGQFAAKAGTPSSLWSAAEQAQWRMYDLAGFYLPDHAVPEVLRVAPVDPAADSAWQIVTRFWPRSPTPRDSSTKPVLTMTVFARREGRRWVLANALSFRTATWARESRGRISFRVAPALTFNAEKAQRAAAFVDSLATAFGVPAPDRIDYYVTESVDQALEVLGVVVPEHFGAAGGFAKPVNGQVFSGIPELGENYRHELAHVVLLPVLRGSETTLLASEGVSTWLGGTAGRDFSVSVRQLDSLLRARPRLTLDAIVDSAGVSAEIRNTAGAVLADMVNEAGGAQAVREYLRSGSGPRSATIRSALERLLKRPWSAIVTDWRRVVARLAVAGR
jgi:hypothetical protein